MGTSETTYRRYQDLELQAKGRWDASLEALDTHLHAFAQSYREPLGDRLPFTFYLIDDPQAALPARRRWLIGAELAPGGYTYTTEADGREVANPNFQGWPYAQVVANEAAGARGPWQVELWSGAAHRPETGRYLAALQRYLAGYGLEWEEEGQSRPIAIPPARESASPQTIRRNIANHNRRVQIWKEIERRRMAEESGRYIYAHLPADREGKKPCCYDTLLNIVKQGRRGDLAYYLDDEGRPKIS